MKSFKVKGLGTHIDMWDIVENGNHIHIHDNGTNLPKSLWNEEQKLKPQVTTLRVSKDLKKLSMEELFSPLKTYKIELKEDEG
ncbi:hypothetical protein CR513_24767, partial [Mucuna pruriens]